MNAIPLGDARGAGFICHMYDNVWQVMYIMHDPMPLSAWVCLFIKIDLRSTI